MGEELSLEDEKLNQVVQGINNLVRVGNKSEGPVAILFPWLVKAFPNLFIKVRTAKLSGIITPPIGSRQSIKLDVIIRGRCFRLRFMTFINTFF